MATKPKRWPKASNEVRISVIDEAGNIREKVETIREEIEGIKAAIHRRDLVLAMAIATNLDSMAETIGKSAEIIVIKLENAKPDEE